MHVTDYSPSDETRIVICRFQCLQRVRQQSTAPQRKTTVETLELDVFTRDCTLPKLCEDYAKAPSSIDSNTA
jgi:hypothetical protein